MIKVPFHPVQMADTTHIVSLDIPADGSTIQAPHQTPSLMERTHHTLLRIIRANFNTQYATQAPTLSAFRDTVAAHGGTEVDGTLLADFRAHVPLSNYDCYKPFADKFNARPCRKEEVENMFAPGLPEFLATTSGTSGTTPKIQPKYNHNAQTPMRHPIIYPDSKYPLAGLQYCGYIDAKEMEYAPGQALQKIPVCTQSAGTVRRLLGWKFDDDERRMSLTSMQYSFTAGDTY